MHRSKNVCIVLGIFIGAMACSAAPDVGVTKEPNDSEPQIYKTEAVAPEDRFELPKPGPMLPPVPAIVLGVQGNDQVPDDLTVVWTYVLNGNPPQVGISVGDDSAITGHKHAGLDLIREHKEFTLNVPDASWIESFDGIDMTASKLADKFEANSLTRLPSKLIGAPGVAEAAIVLECRVLQEHRLPPSRTVFFAEVVRTTVHPGVTDKEGKLDSLSRPFFGMTAGNGEFWTFGKKAGRIGMTVGREDIRY